MALYVERDGKRVEIPREVVGEGRAAVAEFVEKKLPASKPKKAAATVEKSPKEEIDA